MKKLVFYSALFIFFLLSACGNKKEENAAGSTESEKVCSKNSHFRLEINKEKLNNNESFSFKTNDFEIQSVVYSMKSDSVADIRISNYSSEEFSGSLNDEQIDICISLYSKNGKRLKPGLYRYLDFDADYYSKVNIVTSKGVIWFNWVSGMPVQGGVEVYQIDKVAACGVADLTVDKIDNKSIGVVKLSGNFFAEAK